MPHVQLLFVLLSECIDAEGVRFSCWESSADQWKKRASVHRCFLPCVVASGIDRVQEVIWQIKCSPWEDRGAAAPSFVSPSVSPSVPTGAGSGAVVPNS
jgi:hypothetical protein